MPSNLIFFIDLAARSAIVLAIAWGVILALPKLSAAARYWVWLTALCALPLLPLSNTFLPSITIFDLSPQQQVVENSSAPISMESLPDAPFPTGDSNVPALAPSESPVSADPLPIVEAPMVASPPEVPAPSRLPLIVSVVYAAVVGALMLPLGLGLFRLRRLRKRSRRPDAKLASEIDRLLGDAPKPTVLVSPEVTIPLTWGTTRPVILLRESAAEWSRARLQVVLSHEMAHIGRRDFATGLAASVLRAAFWFQPLAWIAHRRLRVEREIACDDRVLQSEASTPPEYAEHLSEVVRGADDRHLVAGIAMARPSEIVGRVRAILDSARNRAGMSTAAKKRTTLLALVVLVPLAFVRCTGEKQVDADELKTSNGITLRAIDPKGITIAVRGAEIEIPDVEEFHMATREVTQSEFQELLGHNPSSTKATHLPVDRVTRTEAASFCKVLTERDRAADILPEGKIYRLPTQQEWIIAALPGGLVPEGEGLEAIAWLKGNSAGLLHPVGAKEANAYGLHDMIGNAAEWADSDPENGMGGNDSARYLGRVTLQIHWEEEAFAGKKVDFKTFMQTQFAIIESHQTVMPVVEELDLVNRWSLTIPEEAYEKISRNLRAQDVRGTDLVEITYIGQEANEAAEIANKIAKSYQDRMKRLRAAGVERQLEELDLQVESQQKLTDEARERMLKTMKDSNIVDLGGERPEWMTGGLNTDSGQIVMTGRMEEKQLKAELETLRTTIDTLMDIEGDEIIKNAAKLGLDSSTITARYPEYQTALLSKKALLDSGLGEEHPDVQTVQKQIDALREVLVDEVKNIKKVLGTKLAIAEQNLAKAKERKKEAEEESLNEKRRSIEYLATKDEYELMKALLTELKQRAATAKVNLKMPRHSVMIHELAEPRSTPANPQAGFPQALGGTAFDDIQDLFSSSGPGNGRLSGHDKRFTGVGFRFVMADE